MRTVTQSCLVMFSIASRVVRRTHTAEQYPSHPRCVLEEATVAPFLLSVVTSDCVVEVAYSLLVLVVEYEVSDGLCWVRDHPHCLVVVVLRAGFLIV